MARDDVGGLEVVQHRGDGGRVEVGAAGQLTGGHLALAPERRQRAKLGEGELAGTIVVTAAQAPLRAGHVRQR